jgi:hypothetical protein
LEVFIFYLITAKGFFQDNLQFPGLCERGKTSVVGFFHIRRKAAARQLLHRQMVTYALTADAFIVTAGICAGAAFQVLLLFAFHRRASPF